MKTIVRCAGLLTAAMGIVSCTPTAFLNLTAPTSVITGPFGLPQPRTLQMVFVNNTPFRAIFTFGGYDPLDKNTSPTGFGQLRLAGNSTSTQITQSCRKTFSVGGQELKRLIEANDLFVNDPRALVDNVNFSGAPPGDPLEAAPTEGTAQALVLQNAVDYHCQALMVFTFVQDAAAPGGFRIDYSFLPP